MREALITPDGLARLTEELKHLSHIGRREVAEWIRHAGSKLAEPLVSPTEPFERA